MKIRTKDAATLLGTTPYSLTCAIECQEKGYEFGLYNKRKGKKRGHVTIIPSLFAKKLEITEEELQKKLEELQKS